MGRNSMSPEIGRRYWRKTSGLMGLVLAVWAVLAFVLPPLADRLNGVAVLGLPLGYLLVGQGTLLGFVILVFWHTRRQNAIDERFHLSED